MFMGFQPFACICQGQAGPPGEVLDGGWSSAGEIYAGQPNDSFFFGELGGCRGLFVQQAIGELLSHPSGAANESVQLGIYQQVAYASIRGVDLFFLQ